MVERKTALVTVSDNAEAGGNVLYAGIYCVEMPGDYDSELLTGEDILMDDAVWVVEPVEGDEG